MDQSIEQTNKTRTRSGVACAGARGTRAYGVTLVNPSAGRTVQCDVGHPSPSPGGDDKPRAHQRSVSRPAVMPAIKGRSVAFTSHHSRLTDDGTAISMLPACSTVWRQGQKIRANTCCWNGFIDAINTCRHRATVLRHFHRHHRITFVIAQKADR